MDGSPKRTLRATALAACTAAALFAGAAAADEALIGERLRLASSQSADRVAADVDAVVDFPFAQVREALADVRDWCEILMLHPNVEHCEASAPPRGDGSIELLIGRMHVPMRLAHRVGPAKSSRLEVLLAAEQGPLDTSDYRLALDATPIDAQRTRLRVTFSHRYGAPARIAMVAYLATLGRDKVGFTVIGRDANGAPRYVDGFRGALERNVMRFDLAIEAYLASLSAPPADQRDMRLRAWYAAAGRYARQLGEDADFVAHKQTQLARHPS